MGWMVRGMAAFFAPLSPCRLFMIEEGFTDCAGFLEVELLTAAVPSPFAALDSALAVFALSAGSGASSAFSAVLLLIFDFFFTINFGDGVRQPCILRRRSSCRGWATALPLARSLVARDLIQGAPAEHRVIVLINVVTGNGVLVAVFDEQPLRAFASRTPRTHARQHKTTLELLPVQDEFQVALFEHGVQIALRLPSADVPYHNRARPV